MKIQVGRWFYVERCIDGDIIVVDTYTNHALKIERADAEDFLKAIQTLIPQEKPACG